MLPNDRFFKGMYSVEFEGRTYYRFYRVLRQGKLRLVIHIISVNSTSKQGIAFQFSRKPKYRGTLAINGIVFAPKKKQQYYVLPVLWPEQKEIVIDLDIKDGYFVLANASDYLDDDPLMTENISKMTGRTRDNFRENSFSSGFTAANIYGNAFWIETLSENCLRFYCNDHKMNDDFNDMVFDLNIMIF